MNLKLLHTDDTSLLLHSLAIPISELSTEYLSSLEKFRQLPVEQMVLLVRSGTRAPATLIERCRIFLMLARLRTTVPSLLCYALGFSYTGAEFSTRTVLAAVLSFLGACLSNLTNTYTDLEEDCRNLPGRIYLLTKLGYKHLFWLIVVINLFMLVAAATLNIYAFLVTFWGLFFVNQYSFPPLRMKAHPIMGLWFFAQAVIIPFLLGGVTESGTLVKTFLSF